MRRIGLLSAIFFLISIQVAAAQVKMYDLANLFQNNKLTQFNRTVSLSTEKGSVRLTENDNAGLAWLKDVTFSNGIIEVDLKGKDLPQRSFIGIAFHGVNDSTYDAIYFRPFNFHSKDSIRKIHAVQYISHPDYGWPRLRSERNGEFEKALVNPPDPNQWFHIRIVVKDENVSVFVNDDKIPSLTIKKLNARKTGSIGLWVGPVSDSEFKNLKITAN
jgi:hypothetical protein